MNNEGTVIRVFRNSCGEYRVWPPVLVVHENDEVTVLNLTGLALTVDFPVLKVPLLQINGRGRGSMTVAAPAGVYHYAVTGNGFRATGNSDPSIIVD